MNMTQKQLSRFSLPGHKDGRRWDFYQTVRNCRSFEGLVRKLSWLKKKIINLKKSLCILGVGWAQKTISYGVSLDRLVWSFWWESWMKMNNNNNNKILTVFTLTGVCNEQVNLLAFVVIMYKVYRHTAVKKPEISHYENIRYVDYTEL